MRWQQSRKSTTRLSPERNSNWLKPKSSTKSSSQKKRPKKDQKQKKLPLRLRRKLKRIREGRLNRESRSFSMPSTEEKPFNSALKWVILHPLASTTEKESHF